jgi:hypothetical protein
MCLKHIVSASLAAFAVYMASVFILAAIFEHNKTVRLIAAYVFLMVAYALFFYRFHAHDRLDTYAEHTAKFSWTKELVAYTRSEDKVLFLIYGISAVVTDVSGVVTQYAPTNPIGITMFYLGPWLDLHIPVLCSLVGFVYSFSVACVIALLRSRKIYQEETKPKKRPY